MASEVSSLEDQAQKFAQSLTATVHAVDPDCEPFTAKYVEGAPRLAVRQSPSKGIPLKVDGVPFLDLKVIFECCMDSKGDYLAVEKSRIEVTPKAGSGPTFRYEYDRNYTKAPPAHMHVHAHRDAFTYLMATAGNSSKRSKRRVESGKVPSLQDIHFPLGGHRFRPCLEDILEILIEEFGVDMQPGTLKALRDGRANWRRTQARSVARDDPQSAVDVLRSLGYDVVWNRSGEEPPVRWDRLEQY
ncbi:hypothetical protein [Brevibacterium linens]|uniref:hypothetical protein n=1 Tax=Brevibacterium linens TaxID=1703 RepID=UPI003BF4B45D